MKHIDIKLENDLGGLSGKNRLDPSTQSSAKIIELELAEAQKLLNSRPILEGSSLASELESIMYSIEEGVLTFDANMKLKYINSSGIKLLGVNDLVDRTLSSQVPGAILNTARKVLEKKTPIHSEIVIGESRRTMELRGNLLHSQQFNDSPVSSTSGVLVVLKDVTELRRLEKVRRDFVANVSHELKTPIASIQGFAETLLNGAVDDSSVKRHFLEIVLHQAKRLKNIIDDLLQLSVIEETESNKAIVMQRTSLPSMLESVLSLSREKARLKGITLTAVQGEELFLEANRLLFEQALVNLLDNAVKYTNEGGRVAVAYYVLNERLIIEVSDTGIGIPPEHLARLFERFYRVDEGRSRKEGGTGLGLAIVKHIVCAHRGQIWVDSKIGVGTKFYIELPFEQEALA